MHTVHTEPALLTTPLMYSLWKVSAVSGPGLLLLWCSGLALEDNLSAILVTAELQHNNITHYSLRLHTHGPGSASLLPALPEVMVEARGGGGPGLGQVREGGEDAQQLRGPRPLRRGPRALAALAQRPRALAAPRPLARVKLRRRGASAGPGDGLEIRGFRSSVDCFLDKTSQTLETKPLL